MKPLRRNMRIVGTALCCLFLWVVGWFAWNAYTQGPRWLGSEYNGRLSSARSKVVMGDITDRSGVLLASTGEDGMRSYAASQDTRRALSQTIGDPLSMSGTGVETFHAGHLLGFSGSILDRAWLWFSGESTRGDDIRLTVDAQLTTYISQQFPDGYAGAVVLLNYKTGEILAMVSKPDYDPATVASRSVAESAYFNRCLQGVYAPGSVFKIVTAATALTKLPGVEDRIYTCASSHLFGESLVSCAGGTAHGQVDLRMAFAKSCNVTFAALSYELGLPAMLSGANAFGFNDNFQFQDIVLYESSFPDDIATLGELSWSGVGQGRVTTSPMHMAMIAASVANDGVMMAPQLIAQVTGATGLSRLRVTDGAYRTAMSREVAATLKSYMREAVLSGTATNAAVSGYAICGKTGSAETSDDKSVPTNAWFVGFVDDADHPFAIAVVIEQGGSGGQRAASLASKSLAKAIQLINY